MSSDVSIGTRLNHEDSRIEVYLVVDGDEVDFFEHVPRISRSAHFKEGREEVFHDFFYSGSSTVFPAHRIPFQAYLDAVSIEKELDSINAYA